MAAVDWRPFEGRPGREEGGEVAGAGGSVAAWDRRGAQGERGHGGSQRGGSVAGHSGWQWFWSGSLGREVAAHPRKARKYLSIAKNIDDSLPAYARQAEQGAYHSMAMVAPDVPAPLPPLVFVQKK